MDISGQKLRLLRQIKGIKQNTMAKSLGITQPAYCKIEKSKLVNRKRFEKIILIMGYSQAELIDLLTLLPQ